MMDSTPRGLVRKWDFRVDPMKIPTSAPRDFSQKGLTVRIEIGKLPW